MSLSLVAYSSSSSDENDAEDSKLSMAKKRLPLPLTINKIEHQDTDNMNVHKGRIRSFPHERGVWATYIYIEVNMNDAITKLQNQCLNYIADNVKEQIHLTEHTHVSLTRTVVLYHHWIESFTNSIKYITSNTKRFSIDFNKLDVLCNDENTRSFIVLGVAEQCFNELTTLANLLNKCLKDYDLSSYYSNASFHTSILWTIGNIKQNLSELHIQNMQELLNKLILEDDTDFKFTVNNIHCKVGNKLYSFGLQK